MPPNYPIRNISFRSQLDGEVLQFLKDEKVECTRTTDAVVQVILSIANYREEGIAFYPRIFIINDVQYVRGVLPGSEHLELGSGERNVETIKDALRRCAPLARGGWSIYIERQETAFRYGLFITENQPLSIGATELLMLPELPSEQTPFPVLLLEQLAENVVELRSNSGRCLRTHLSGSRTDLPSPRAAQDDFFATIVQDVKPRFREPVLGFVQRVLTDAFQSSHGTLGAVVATRHEKLPAFFSDAVNLSSFIDIQERVIEFETKKDVQAMSRLQSIEHLIHGMVRSDGITVFRSDAQVLGFRVFVGSTGGSESGEVIIGGARRRAYHKLCSKLGRGIIAAYFQSQDGHAECRRSQA